MIHIWIDFKRMSPFAADVAQKAADYCFPRTLESAWGKIYTWREIEEIGKYTFDQIVENISFFFPNDASMIEGEKTPDNYMSHSDYIRKTNV